MSLSLSDIPPVKITSSTAQDISDEILGGAIHFCRETGCRQSIMTLTLFWSAFLFSARDVLEEHKIIGDITKCYNCSLSRVFPKILEDKDLRAKADDMLRHFGDKLAADYSYLLTESEIRDFLQFVNIFNTPEDAVSTNQLKPDSQKVFLHVASTIRLSIDRILHQIDNGFGIKYRYVLDTMFITEIPKAPSVKKQVGFTKVHSAKPEQAVNMNNNSLGMAWYKFLIYFALFAGAIMNLVNGFGYLTGSIYIVETNGQITAEEVYNYYGYPAMVTDIMYGLFLVILAVFAFVLRSKLANYRPDAPKMLYIFYSLVAVVPLVYSIVVAAITLQPLASSSFSSLLGGLLILFLNVKYFKKREHLFVDKTATPPYVTQPPTRGTQNILFCEKCGKKLSNDSVFCKHCGTKILK